MSRLVLVTVRTLILFGCQVPWPGQNNTLLRVALPSFGPELLDPSMDTKSGLQYHGHMFDNLLGGNVDDSADGQLGVL